MSRLIGISGKSGAGKDFIAKKIIEKYPQYKIGGFADPLRFHTGMMLGIEPASLKDQDVKKSMTRFGVTVREFMIQFGMGMRKINNDFWVDLAMDKYLGTNTILTDLRFPNEFNHIRSNGGMLIRVERHLPRHHWFELMGIDVHSGSNQVMTKYQAIVSALELKSMLSEQELKSLEAAMHESETLLDTANFDYVIHNLYNAPLTVTELIHVFSDIERGRV
jgi:hypothetical protein